MKIELLHELSIEQPGWAGLEYFPDLSEGTVQLKEFLNLKNNEVPVKIINAKGIPKQVNAPRNILSAIQAETTDEYDLLINLTRIIEQEEFLVIFESPYSEPEGLRFPKELNDLNLVLSDNHDTEILLRPFICSLAIEIAEELQKAVIFIYHNPSWDNMEDHEIFFNGKLQKCCESIEEAKRIVMIERKYSQWK